MPVRKPKLLIIGTHPIQYYGPLYRELVARGAVDVHVIYLSDSGAVPRRDEGFGQDVAWDIPLLEGYESTILRPGFSLNGVGAWGRHDERLWEECERVAPDWLLLYGYASRMNWAALLWAVCRGVRIAYTSDSNANNPRSLPKRIAKQIVVRGFFRWIDAFFATSESNRTYLEEFGARPERIHRIPFAIDVERFSRGAPPLGSPRPFDFVWVGKVVELKRLDVFFDALELAGRATERKFGVLIVGDGPLREEMEKRARRLPPTCSVEWSGFVNQSELPGALQKAHTLVFTSERDAYGLVVTEAAAAGLALIVAERNGCVGPTVIARPGVNALVYPAENPVLLSRALARIAEDVGLRLALQKESRSIVREHDFGAAAAVIERVLASTDGGTIA